jgi:uncharacterized protein DUF4169
MGDVVNLNKYRKQKAKADRDKLADQNRRLHGRTKSERSREELQKQKLTRDLEGARLEHGTASTSSDAESEGGDEGGAAPHSGETESE